MLLNALREGKTARFVKIIALAFVMLGVCGMIFMDVGGVLRNGLTETTLARIGKTKISAQAFERMATPAVHAQNMNLQEAYRFGLLQNILDEMVAREVLRQETSREGLIIGRDEIATRVHDLIKAQIQPGETAQKTLERLLASRGLTQEDLVNSVRQGVTAQLLDAPLKASVSFVPKLATQALERFHAERRDITFFMLTPEGVGASIKADDDALKAYYETVKDEYQIPEQRTFRTVALDANSIKSSISISEADVKAAYDERKDQFRTGERRKIQQGIFQDETQAKQATEQARAKAPLRKIAGSAYRDPAEVEQAGLPAELGSAVFAAQKGDILNPIKTPLGWHVIEVLDIIPARTQPYAEVQASLRKELESDALHSEMESRVAKMEDELGQGNTIDQLAQNLGLPIVSLGPVDAQGNTGQPASAAANPLMATLTQNKDLLSSLFELMEGETSDLAEINDTTYAVFTLENVTPSRDRDFAEVKSEIEQKWLQEQRTKALDTAVAKVMDEVTKGGKDFATAAKEAGAVLKTARDVSRQSKVAGLNDPVALTRLFDETDLDAVVKVPTDKGVILAKVLDARIPEAGTVKTSPESEQQWRTQMEQALTMLFVSDLRRDNKVKVNKELLERMYGEKTDAQP